MKTIALSYWHLFSARTVTKVLGKCAQWFCYIFTGTAGVAMALDIAAHPAEYLTIITR